MGENVSFVRPDGKNCNGYGAEPPDKRGPGVVVVQEWWGLNDQIKGMADKLAAEGFRVLVPDLYHGKVTVEEAEASHLMGGLDFGAAASQDIRGAAQHLKVDGGSAGIIGFCMGGALAVLSAAYVPELDAAVSCTVCHRSKRRIFQRYKPRSSCTSRCRTPCFHLRWRKPWRRS